jgi:hypothetical protein
MCKTFLNIYNDVIQTVLQENPVLFNNHRIIVGNCGHVLNSGNIEVWEPGYYYIHYNISHQEPVQLAIFLNNTILVGTTVGTQNAGDEADSTAIVRIDQNDIINQSIISPTGLSAWLELRNHTSFTPTGITINGHQGSGSQLNQRNASAILLQLSAL